MLTPAATMSILPLDAVQPLAEVTSEQQAPNAMGGEALTDLAQRAQESLQGAAAPLGVLLDPARSSPLSTSELLTLQVAVSDYSIRLLTLSHMAQSVGSAIQSLTQRT